MPTIPRELGGTPEALGLPIPGHVRRLKVDPGTRGSGSPFLHRDKDGNGWHGVELYGIGPMGGVVPFAVLSPDDARALAGQLVSAAARLEIAEAADRLTHP